MAVLPRPGGRCKALYPCSCCLPGVSRYSRVTLRGQVPQYGIDFTTTLLADTLPRRCHYDDGTHELLFNGAPHGWTCCGCQCIYSTFAELFDGACPDYCAIPFNCGDASNCYGCQIVGSYLGHDIGLVPETFNFECLGLGPLGQSGCQLLAHFDTIVCDGSVLAGIGNGSAFGSDALDPATAVWKCPAGLHLEFGPLISPWPPTGGSSSLAGSKITITADEPTCTDGVDTWPCPCPEHFPCPDSSVPCWNQAAPDQNDPPTPPGHCGKCDVDPDNADCCDIYPGGPNCFPGGEAALVASLTDAQVDRALAAQLSRRA
jgi:hypothetical protein